MSPRCFGKVMTGWLSGRQAHRIWCHPAPRQQQCPSSDGGARLSSTGSSDTPTANASPERRRLTLALLLSLLIHTLLLSLIFGGQGRWLPGFAFPWQDRRIEVPDLRVDVVPAQVTAAEPAVRRSRSRRSRHRSSSPLPVGRPDAIRSPVRRPRGRRAAAIVPEANPRAGPTRGQTPRPVRPPAQTPLRADRPGDTAPPPIPAPAVIALPRTDEAHVAVPATPATPPPVIAAAPSVSIPEIRDAVASQILAMQRGRESTKRRRSESLNC